MNGMFVLDASAAVAWASPDESPPSVLSRAIETQRAAAPALWVFEVCNVLHVLRRRGRLVDEDWDVVSDALSILPIELEEPVRARVHGDVIRLAAEYNLSVYDAAYLELASRRQLPIASLDKRLRSAAKEAGVETLL